MRKAKRAFAILLAGMMLFGADSAGFVEEDAEHPAVEQEMLESACEQTEILDKIPAENHSAEIQTEVYNDGEQRSIEEETDSGLVRSVRVMGIAGSARVVEGGTLTLRAVLEPLDATLQTVRWESADESIATVSGSGVVTAKSTDRMRTVEISAISADAGAARGSMEISIYPACDSFDVLREGRPVLATEIVEIGESASFALEVLPANAFPGRKVASADAGIASVAEVDGGFVVTGRGAGTVKLTAASGDGRASKAFQVRVQKSVESIALPKSVELGHKQAMALSPAVLPGDATNRAVVWRSEDAKVVSVSAKGAITGLKVGGPVRITATAADGSGVVAEVLATVKPPATSVRLSAQARTIDFSREDKALQIEAAIAPSAAGRSLNWKSSKPAVATVDSSGLVTAVGVGTATITATAADGSKKYGTISISVVLPVAGISIDGAREVGVKRSIALRAMVQPSNATHAGVTWSSADKKIATVSGKGVVTGVKAGTTVVYARAGGISASCAITVNPSATGVQVEADALEFDLDDPESPEIAHFSAAVQPATAAQGVIWTSSNASVATVDGATGVVRIVGGGTAKITATAADGSKKSASKTIKVVRKTQALAVLGAPMLAVGKSTTLTVARTPLAVSNAAVKWESSDPKAASVSAKGVVKGLRTGEVVIAAVAQDGSGVRGEIVLNITPAANGVRIVLPAGEDAIINLNSEGSLQLSAAASPAGAAQRFVWKCSNAKVAAVDANGLVIPTAPGSAKITATAADGTNKAASIAVRIQYSAGSVSIAGAEEGLDLGAGRTARLLAAIEPERVTNRALVWKTSNKKVATVSTKGVVKGVGAGTATISATAADGSGARGKIEVRVYPVAKSIALSEEGRAISSGATLQFYSAGASRTLRATISPASAHGEIVWSSSRAAVATVVDGVITAVGAGSAKITATAGDGSGKSASVHIAVGPAVESVEISGAHAVAIGRTIALSAAALPADAINAAVSWTSDNPAVATVSSKGVVSGKKAGRARITATAGSVRCAHVVDVVPKATSVEIIHTGEQRINLHWATRTLQLSALVWPLNASQSVAWKSSDTKIATVNGNGVVTGLRPGAVRIVATAADGSGRIASATIRVVAEELTIRVEGDLRELASGCQTTLRAIAQDTGDAAKVDWSSSDPALAAVDARGTVTANARGLYGEVYIEATSREAPGVKAGYALFVVGA